MIDNRKPKLGYDDVSVVPAPITNIKSRKECFPYDENGMLPIFASPMDTVINEENVKDFVNNKINVVIPRNIPIERRIELAKENNCFFAISLKEAQGAADAYESTLGPQGWLRTGGRYKICVDIANGHMTELIDACSRLKKLPDVFIEIMTGNIANPETYRYYDEAGIDYVRCSIGTGAGCLTASNTSIFYPQFSLLEEIYWLKKRIGGRCKIIADGGIRGYRDIQKALVFADYVMIGGLFNRMIESAGKTTYGKRYFNINGYKLFRPITTLFTYGKEIPRGKFEEAFKLFKENKLTIFKEFRGMSTKEAQKGYNPNGKTKTSEGKKFYQKVENNIPGWVENETDYLRSAMSYTNSRDLAEYKESEYVVANSIAYNR